jgi:hypothetical protein
MTHLIPCLNDIIFYLLVDLMSAPLVSQMAGVDISCDVRSAVNKHVFASFRVFDALEPDISDESKISNNQSSKSRLIDASIMFRNNLNIFSSDIGSIADGLFAANSTNDASTNVGDSLIASLDRTLDITNRIEGVWGLCEIFFLRSSGSCFFEMAQWLQVHTHFT